MHRYMGGKSFCTMTLFAGTVLAVTAIALATLLPMPESVSANSRTFKKQCKTKGAITDSHKYPGLVRDCVNLLKMADKLSGDGDPLNWRASAPMAQWQGITIEGTPPRVTGIEVVESGLSGTIPGRQLSKLTELTHLKLSANSLTGEVPGILSRTYKLESLHLYKNNLSGKIPSKLGQLSNLEVLDLEGNGLSVRIPAELSRLSKLTSLNLEDNNLSGNIPAELGDLSALKSLTIGENRLKGSIPTELGDLSSLKVLPLNQNRLKGNIPVELAQLSKLILLDLDHNKLKGKIPEKLGNLQELKVLRVNDNQLSRCIPASLRHLRPVESREPEESRRFEVLRGVRAADRGKTHGTRPPHIQTHQWTRNGRKCYEQRHENLQAFLSAGAGRSVPRLAPA